MIGIALVTFVSVLANGMKASNRGAIEDQVQADFVVTATDGFSPFVAGAGNAIANAPRPEEVSPVRSELAEIDGDGGYLTGIDPNTISTRTRSRGSQTRRPSWPISGRRGDRVEEFAEDHNLKVGSPVKVTSSDGKEALLEEGHLRAAALLPDPRRGLDPDRHVRPALRAAAEPVRVRERLRRPGGRAGRPRAGRRRVPGRESPDARGVDHEAGRGLQPVPRAALRAAHPRRDHLALRDGEHADPDRVRADAGAGHAPRDRA